ncbi:30S ribosomal protein S4 [Patescibacteria group bacterium]|nr:30S ribosomal protein S4 [Patescibacteria group bacterium]
MAKNLNPKCKQCRRIGEKLILKSDRCNSPKCAMVKKNYPPGAHGSKRPGKKSDYALQLTEKQKAKKQYNILEKQFKLTFKRAEKQKGNTGENLLKLLETRFDNVIYCLKFAQSKSQARQLVNHGHFIINNHKVDIPSYQVKTGDIIKIKEQSKKNKNFKQLLEKLSKQNKIDIPSWIYLDPKELTGKILHEPSINEIQTNINSQIIVEYYSK